MHPKSKMTKWFGVLILIAIISGYLAMRKAEVKVVTPVETPKLAEAKRESKQAASTASLPATSSAAASTHVDRAPAQVRPDLQSLNEMADTVAAATRGGVSLKGLLERLQKSGQDPRIIRDANPYSGEMIVVRADSPLEGTRYFHAQYFMGEDGQPFVQHMSFEFQPGPNAMNEALAAVAKNFPGLAQPTHQRDGYARWKLDENQILWVKRLTADDVAHDPFNAYSQKNLGAIRVAVEAEIHD